MLIKDPSGLELTGASQAAADKYAEALQAWACYAGDPMALLAEALADSPRFVMAHALSGWLCLMGTNAETAAIGRQSIEAARDLPASPRERAQLAACSAYAAGELRRSARILEDVSIEAPRDIVALQAGQVIDFFLGDSRNLRDRIGRTLPAWSRADADYHNVLGMLAFGLEETGHYARAEDAGREALELERRNSWAQHAVAHVLEMQDRRADGIAFMRADIDAWTHQNFFQVHNWWHLALFHLGLGEVDEVMRLFDGPIFGARSDMALDMVDASAMLWRLHLLGIELGDRWSDLADLYQAKGAPAVYAFDDVHAMMAYVGAGRREAQAEIRKAQIQAIEGPGDNAYFAREVGLPMVDALAAFGEGHFDTVLERLRPVRNFANRFGGSHAQRDLIDLTMIEAARRGGRRALHDALLAERETAKPLVEGERVRRAA
jgi:tetratricopeptide (TPR) repeat protein